MSRNGEIVCGYYDPLELVKAIGTLTKKLDEHGLTVETSGDFAALEAECEAIADKELSEQFGTRFFDLNASTGFWLGARDADGKLVSMQAARVENLHGITLAGHWMQQQRRIYCDPNTDGELGEQRCPGAHMITGTVVYHGDMWLEQTRRGRDLGSILCRMGQLLVLAKWQPDYIYCFMSEALVQKGFSTGQGYFHMQPTGTWWKKAPRHIRPDDWLLWNSATDLRYLAQILALSA